MHILSNLSDNDYVFYSIVTYCLEIYPIKSQEHYLFDSITFLFQKSRALQSDPHQIGKGVV